MKAERGDESLRRFRISLPETDYFITANLSVNPAGCFSPAAMHAIRDELCAMEADGHWRIRATVIMPDHVHVLATLGKNLALSRAIARLKAKTRPVLLSQGLQWQPNFYEHRLRGIENVQEIIRYIFLNPYRSGLVPLDKTYPWFWLGNAESEWFEPETDHGLPFPEWLR